MNIEKEILELLKREGSVTVYRIAKTFGITYGTAQWYIDRLQRLGLVCIVKIGMRRYVVLKGTDPLQKATVKDVLDELTQALSALGIKLEMNFKNALEMLEAKASHLAEVLRLIAQIK
jgi:predicted transcriptional regulator